MGNRKAVDDIELMLEEHARRRRNRRIALAILILILIILLIPWQCSDPGPVNFGQENSPAMPGTQRVASRSPLIGKGNKNYLRKEFANDREMRVAWGRELSDGIDRYGPQFRQCIADETEINWVFQFNPGTGEIHHQDFIDRNGEPIISPQMDCLHQKIPTKMPLRTSYPNAWFRATITLISPGTH